MKTAKLKIKKTIKAKVSASASEVKIKFPKQSLGTVTIHFLNASGNSKMIKLFELWIVDGGDKIKAEAL